MDSNYGNVANILGLKFEEVFIIKEKNRTKPEFPDYYRFTKEGIEQIDEINNTNGKNRDWYLSEPNVIDALLYGKYVEIIKLSQMPKYDEVYYTPVFGSKVMYKKLVWMNDESDRTLYKRGLVFKTSDRAVRAAEKMLAALRQA